jgi:hypothetical protein
MPFLKTLHVGRYQLDYLIRLCSNRTYQFLKIDQYKIVRALRHHAMNMYRGVEENFGLLGALEIKTCKKASISVAMTVCPYV